MVPFCRAPDHFYEVEFYEVGTLDRRKYNTRDIFQLFLITMISAPKSQAPWIGRHTDRM